MHDSWPDVQSRRNSPRAGRGRRPSGTPTGPLTRSREDTEGAATERSSGLSCTWTRSWFAPTAISSSYLPLASRISTHSAVSPSQRGAWRVVTLARRRGLMAVAAVAVGSVGAGAAMTEVRARCSRPPAAIAGSPRKSRSGPRAASRCCAAIASGLLAVTSPRSPS